MKIAFLEDNQHFADETIHALTTAGHEVKYFLTGRDAEEDIVQMMKAVADDYIVKLPSINILNARINALFRRANPVKNLIESVYYHH